MVVLAPEEAEELFLLRGRVQHVAVDAHFEGCALLKRWSSGRLHDGATVGQKLRDIIELAIGEPFAGNMKRSKPVATVLAHRVI